MATPTRKRTHVLILGLGRYPFGSGMGAAQYCHARGDEVVISDRQTRTALAAQVRRLGTSRRITFHFGPQRVGLLKDVDVVVANPGVRRDSPVLMAARRRAIPIETDISLFLRAARPKRIIAVTGTRGKSTTAALLYGMLCASGKLSILAGNIQRSPLFDLRHIKKNTTVVLELSSWQIEGLAHLAWSPHVAVVTNVYSDHLNTYPSFRAYVKAKAALFRCQKPRDLAVLNHDNPATRSFGRAVPGRRWWVSLKSFPEENGLYYKKDSLHQRRNGVERRVADLTSTTPRFARMNIASAAAAALSAGATPAGVRKGIRSFRGLPGRQETVRRLRGVTYINDTTATTPEATMAALEAVTSPVTLIAGGTDKGLSYRDVARHIAQGVQYLILLPGTATTKLLRALPLSTRKKVVRVASMDRAVREAYRRTNAGTILLSPGAASFGLFVNEFDRGDQFTAVVKRLRS